MSAQWYYQREGRAYGPFSSAEFRRLASEKAIEPTTAVRKGDAGRWVSARHVRGLFAEKQPAVSPVGSGEESRRGEVVPDNTAGTTPQKSAAPAPPLVQRRKPWLVVAGLAAGLAVVAAAVGLAGLAWKRQPLELLGAVADRDAFDSQPSAVETPAETGSANDQILAEAQVEPEHRNQSPADSPAATFDSGQELLEPSENVAVAAPLILKPDIASNTAEMGTGPGNDAPAPQAPKPDSPQETTREIETSAAPVEALPEATDDSSNKPEPLPEPSLEPRLQKLREAFEAYREPFASIRPQMEELNALRQEIAQTSKPVAMIQQTLRDKTLIHAKLEQERSKWRRKGAMTPELDKQIQILLQEITTINGELRATISQQQALQQRFSALKPQFDRNCLTTQEAIDRVLPLLDIPGLLAQEDHRQAETVLSQWIEEASDYPLHYLARGFALAYLKQHDRALQDFDLAAKFYSPLAGFVSAARGYVLARSEQMRASAEAFADAEQIHPKSAVVSMLRGYAYLARKDFSYAERQFLQAVRYDESRPEAHEALAYVMATKKQVGSGDQQKAIEHAETACNLTRWNNWSSLDVLAMAYAAAGQFQLARDRAKQALHLAPKSQRRAIEERFELYAAAKPYSIR